jgi:HNH endonuclease
MRRIYHKKVIPLFSNSENLPERKICPTCDLEKELSAQYTLRGDGRYEVRCKDCIRKADRERNHKKNPPRRKIKFVEEPLNLEQIIARKECSLCGKNKNLSEFAQSKTSSDKRSNDCKECREKAKLAKPVSRPGFKICPGCNIEKELKGSFHKVSRKNSYVKYCNQCLSDQYAEDSEKQEKSRLRHQSRKNTPEYIKYHREYENKRYNTIPEVARKTLEQCRLWRINNPLKARNRLERYEARKRGAQVGEVSYENILEQCGYWCHICERSIDPTIKSGPASLAFDHIIPISPRKGNPQGAHSEENIHPSHKVCNSRKSNRPFESLTPFQRRGLGR